MDDAVFDLVVVGSGTGLLGALAAARAGESVLVVEKSRYFGGSTALSGGGFWVPGNALLAENGVVDTRERAMEYLQHVTKGEADLDRLEAFLDHGRGAVDVLRTSTPLSFQWMAEYSDYFPELPGGSAGGRAMEPKPFNVRALGADRALLRPPVFAAPLPMPVTGSGYKQLSLIARSPRGAMTAARLLALGLGGLAIGREYVAGGGALAAGMFAGVRAAGVPVWLDSPLRELVMDGDRVVGVVVERGGKQITVRARRGVLLSAGGFDRDGAMRHGYQSDQLDTSWCLGNPENTGDAIKIAEAAGADLAFMNEAWWFPALPVPDSAPGSLLSDRSLPGQIIVDQAGRRFMNEAVNYMTAGQILIQQKLPVWMVFDQRYRNRYIYGGVAFPRQPLPQSWYDAGMAVKAETLTGLARELGMPELPTTIARFNVMAAAGRDDDFHRGDSAYDRYYGDAAIHPNPCLLPLEKGPYYAVKVVPGDLGTCGGLRADAYARVLRPDHSVIEGLYAAGNSAGNAFARVYPGPGATIGQGLVFSYIAAMHAAGRLKEPVTSAAAA